LAPVVDLPLQKAAIAGTLWPNNDDLQTQGKEPA